MTQYTHGKHTPATLTTLRDMPYHIVDKITKCIHQYTYIITPVAMCFEAMQMSKTKTTAVECKDHQVQNATGCTRDCYNNIL